MPRVILSLGSNTDFGGFSSLAILRHACHELSGIVDAMTVSSIYVTEPMYYKPQRLFLNMAIIGSYRGTPEELLRLINIIEAQFGRNRANDVPKGPRTLDIDIALFGTEAINTKKLTIPHPALCNRGFVLVPLLELLKEQKVAVWDVGYYEECLKKLNLRQEDVRLCMPAYDFGY